MQWYHLLIGVLWLTPMSIGLLLEWKRRGAAPGAGSVVLHVDLATVPLVVETAQEGGDMTVYDWHPHLETADTKRAVAAGVIEVRMLSGQDVLNRVRLTDHGVRLMGITRKSEPKGLSRLFSL